MAKSPIPARPAPEPQTRAAAPVAPAVGGSRTLEEMERLVLPQTSAAAPAPALDQE